MVKIKLRDDVKEFENGITPADVCKEISMGLYRNLCACLINGQSADIRTPINEDCELELLTFDSEEGKHAFWHTASHILAQAVKRLYPEAKLAIGIFSHYVENATKRFRILVATVNEVHLGYVVSG